ncbi:hypothetical protein MED222_06480 [Vibrio sp. MED222]|nr:hypothetical protein MED222_06480 [Vibrio sp. MED222]
MYICECRYAVYCEIPRLNTYKCLPTYI